MTNQLSVLAEPKLRFGMGQTLTDPKQGLFLFGPTRDKVNPLRMRVGVIGTPQGISLYRGWVARINGPVVAPAGSTTSAFFPGFRELLACEWPVDPDISIPIRAMDISAALRISDRHEAVHSTVGLFIAGIEKSLREEEPRPVLWFVIVPDEVYALARPLSRVPVAERTPARSLMTSRLAKRLQVEPSLFDEDMVAAEVYRYDLDFHDQLKARLVSSRAVAQVVRESTLQGEDAIGASRRRMQDAASVAWNLSVSSFYKAGGRPWKLASVRDGVCYVGLVFKRDTTSLQEQKACCGAQMFLTNGDGMVFKGRLGPWYSPETREYHLSKAQATAIASGVLAAYSEADRRGPARDIHTRAYAIRR